jgi:glycosyltransferase involved in cell wall biosynthesis
MSMKLALVGPVHPYRGGIAHFNTQLGQTLLDAGHAVQVVSFSRQYPKWLYPGKTDKDPSQEHPSVPAEYLLDPLYPWTWLRAARAIAARQPELVLVQWWTTFWGPALFCLASLLRARRIPITFVIHNVMPHEPRFFDRAVAKAVLSRASACISLSPQEEQRLHTLLPSMPVVLGRLPVSPITNSRIAKPEARRQLGLPEDEPVLLFFGFVRPYKGLGVMLEALARLKQTCSLTPRLLVAGEFWEDEQAYRHQAEQLGVAGQVRFDNRFIPNEEMGVFFSAADWFAAPYVGGTQSAAIKAAMQFGLPVLASDRIASDLPREGYSLVLHPAGDASALAEDLRRVLEQGPAPTTQSADPGSDGWAELIQTIQTVRDLCQPN